MFSNCIKLEEINLNSFETSLIRDMSYMLYNCSSLENVNLLSFDTSTVTKMDYMFGYSGIKNLNLTSFNTLNAKSFKGIFEECRGLELALIEKNCKNIIPDIPEYVNLTIL